jgi:hypothetical protein
VKGEINLTINVAPFADALETIAESLMDAVVKLRMKYEIEEELPPVGGTDCGDD